jgi:hypothetical protein
LNKPGKIFRLRAIFSEISFENRASRAKEADLRSQAVMRRRFSVVSGKYLVNLEPMLIVSPRVLNQCRCEP